MVGPSRVHSRHVKKNMPMRRERNAKEARTRKSSPTYLYEGEDFIEDFYLESFYADEVEDDAA